MVSATSSGRSPRAEIPHKSGREPQRAETDRAKDPRVFMGTGSWEVVEAAPGLDQRPVPLCVGLGKYSGRVGGEGQAPGRCRSWGMHIGTGILANRGRRAEGQAIWSSVEPGMRWHRASIHLARSKRSKSLSLRGPLGRLARQRQDSTKDLSLCVWGPGRERARGRRGAGVGERVRAEAFDDSEWPHESGREPQRAETDRAKDPRAPRRRTREG